MCWIWVSHNRPNLVSHNNNYLGTGSLFGRSFHEASQKKWRKWTRRKCDISGLLLWIMGTYFPCMGPSFGAHLRIFLPEGWEVGDISAFSHIPLAEYCCWSVNSPAFLGCTCGGQANSWTKESPQADKKDIGTKDRELWLCWKLFNCREDNARHQQCFCSTEYNSKLTWLERSRGNVEGDEFRETDRSQMKCNCLL